MPTPTDYVKKGALRAIEPAISFLARHNVSPNAITTVGTLLTVAAGVVYGTGHIMTAGWLMGLTAFFRRDDGEVARRTGRSMYSVVLRLDAGSRCRWGAYGRPHVFYATTSIHHNSYMMVVCLVG